MFSWETSANVFLVDLALEKKIYMTLQYRLANVHWSPV